MVETTQPSVLATHITASGAVDIWSILKVKGREKKDADAGAESNIIVAGDEKAGKSTLIMRFLEKDDPVTPNVALDYTYARKARAGAPVKDIAHIWEVCSEPSITKALIKSPINPTNIHSTAIFLVMDLSHPAKILDNLTQIVGVINEKVTSVFEGLIQKNSKRPNAMKVYAAKRYGDAHPDRDTVTPCPIPIVVIGSKYDVFRDTESEKCKLLCRGLRYFCHVYGASLVFSYDKEESLVGRCKQFFTQYGFHTNPQTGKFTDHASPLFIMGGQDSFADIGALPNVPDVKPSGQSKQLDAIALWSAAIKSYFPENVAKISSGTENAADDATIAKYSEPEIDKLKARKMAELEKLRANAPPSSALDSSNSTSKSRKNAPAGKLRYDTERYSGL